MIHKPIHLVLRSEQHERCRHVIQLVSLNYLCKDGIYVHCIDYVRHTMPTSFKNRNICLPVIDNTLHEALIEQRGSEREREREKMWWKPKMDYKLPQRLLAIFACWMARVRLDLGTACEYRCRHPHHHRHYKLTKSIRFFFIRHCSVVHFIWSSFRIATKAFKLQKNRSRWQWPE